MTESDQRAARLGRFAERASTKAKAATKGAVSKAAGAGGGSGSSGKVASKRQPRTDHLERRQAARTEPTAPMERPAVGPSPAVATGAVTAAGRRPRKARLRLTQLDAWSVMKTSFLLSIAMGIVTVVAVGIVWTVLGAAGVWDSLNSTIQTVMGNSFRIQDYVGTGRVLGFTMLVAAVDVAFITAIATLSAFLYNLSATLLGGIEVTLTEDQ